VTEIPNNRPIFKNLGGWLCLDFINTQNWGTHERRYERFETYPDFVRFACHFELLTEAEAQLLRQEAIRCPEESLAMFEAGLALRDMLHRILGAVAGKQAPPPADLAALNGLLSRIFPHLHLIPSVKGFTWSWTSAETDLEQVFWPVIYSAAELLTSEKLARLGQCAGKDCGWLFLDTSRNHSRRWCEMKHCGNRVKAHRHYQRRQAGSPSVS
jgi:predicted RNA-binding Zn ribbon-like protein